MSPVLRVALGEYDTGWHDRTVSLGRAASVVEEAARSGAALVALPEMCTTGFTMDAARQGEPLDGASGRALGRIAAASGVHLLAGIALRECVEGQERATNAAVLFDQGGTVRTVYRKQRVFGYAGEDDVYTPGRRAEIATVQGVRIAPFICYDLRFPELFRQVACDVDAIVVIANWPASRRAHWDALLRARAIENQCYVLGVNRIGEGNGIPYDGGSAAFDPWGLPLGAGIVSVDAERVRTLRAEYPFLRDYGG